ncbi:(3R)-2'-hydroxyisoflavanone reductase [Salvia divinorum]|uniref:(3R)-2'-hydroxyisoflavanone reductase n=1 Tax=Salvia divinorum TaxID=28513 RepID=A0ABD1IIW2_SALDI
MSHLRFARNSANLRVVYTTAAFKMFGVPYIVTNTVVERAAIDLASELGLDLVSVLRIESSPHIHLIGGKGAIHRGRGCSPLKTFAIFFSAKYPEYPLPTPDLWKDLTAVKLSGLSIQVREWIG